MKNVNFILLLLLLVVVAGCSSGNSDAPLLGSDPAPHPTNWVSLHGAQANADLRGCQGCHGFDFKGTGQAVSCYTCHDSGPPFTGHPASWNGNPLSGHQANFRGDLTDKTSWNSCATAACHGTDLQGTGTSGAPSCMNNTASCHATSTDGWPPAPHPAYLSGAVHGPAAKGVTDPNLSMGNYCAICHADTKQPLATRFNGGFVALYYITGSGRNGNCSACHTAATAHPTNWASSNPSSTVVHNDGNISANPNIKSDSCALCHTTTANTPPSPFPNAPTCFDDTIPGLPAGSCHAGGPEGAPHVMPFVDPNLHGPAAKADLAFCQTCHGDNGTAGAPGVPGSNPRFNIPKGSMTNGCEDCHATGSAHATGVDRWTFNKDATYPTRRTHFAAGNVNTGCVLCHDATSGTSDDGGLAPACTTCHTSLTASGPAAVFDCTVCHAQPPTTGTDLTGGTVVDHTVGTDVTAISNHEDCSICHGASESIGTPGTLVAKSGTSSYIIFNGTGAGGNHLDGKIEVNSDVGYDNTNFGCNLACHPNNTTHRLSGSGLTNNTGQYTSGTVTCTDCHGYPPTPTTKHAPGAIAVDHTGTGQLLTNHIDCQLCHGTREGAPGTHDPVTGVGGYDPLTDHYDGNINMNAQTGYDTAKFGCANTGGCHGIDPQHQLSDSGLPNASGNYGVGSCSYCHGYPPDGSPDLTGATPVDHTKYSVLLANHGDCRTCHGTRETSPGSATHDPVVGVYDPLTHHRDGKIEMNSDAQYQDVNAAVPSERFGCNAACHGNNSTHQLSDSGLGVIGLALGVSGACDTCHGNPPIANTFGGPNGLDNSVGTGSATSGKHDLHANTKGYGCDTCHTGTTTSGQMPNGGDINIGFNIVLGVTTDTTGTYDGRSTGGGYTPATGTSVTSGGGLTCSALYCHGTSTPKWLDTEPAMACGSCHGRSSDGMPSTTPGDGDLSGAVVGKKVGKHANHVVNQGFACRVCHNGAGDGTTKHVDGANDIVFDTALASASATFTAGTSTCSNLACHSDQIWDTATPALACNSCHGYPPTSAADAANNRHASGATAVNHDIAGNGVTTAITGNHSECNTCHGKSQANGLTDNTANGGDAYLASYHIDGNIEMNGWATDSGQDAQYQQSNFGCAKACHPNDAAHQLSDSALPVQLHRYGAGDCKGCHAPGGSGPTVVYPTGNSGLTGELYGSHLKAATTDTISGTTDWSLQCQKCHGFHSGDVQVPNNATVGINYTTHGGIWLGGTATGGKTTEAEICWNCHDTNGISEWGTNTDTNGTYPNYDFGTLSNSNWTTATWTSANFAYKTAAIQSTHSVNPAGSSAVTGTAYNRTESPDSVANIRCSYCHDVHNRNQATGDTVTGKPYLRGTWFGNPYFEDGAPTDYGAGTNTFETVTQYGRVPRGSINEDFFDASGNAKGGYWIDQNMNAQGVGTYPTSETLSSMAGLCTLCHGTNVDAMDQTTGENLWVGINGHSNAVIGGLGSNKTEILDRSKNDINKKGNVVDMGQSGDPNQTYDRPEGWGYRDNGDYTPGYAPRLINGNPAKEQEPWKNSWFDWGVSARFSGDTYTQYHQFTCSKCHNPHASRLPKLMISNCLDTKHNTWQNAVSVDDNSPSTKNSATTATPTRSDSWHASNWSTSQNCHRVGNTGELTPGGDGRGDMDGKGWNTVTPW